MKFINVDFNNGEMYYAGEAIQGYRGYEPAGIGVMKWTNDETILMCTQYSNDGPNGLGFEYHPNERNGSMSTYNYGRYYGPTIRFKYETALIYENYDYNERPRNFSACIYYDGNYMIYEESNASILNGVAYYNGYLYFVKLDQQLNIINRKTIKYVGEDYRFTSKRMFSLRMDENKPVYNKTGTTKSGLTFELGTQLLTPYSTTYFGYGAIKWSDGSYYFGEWTDDNRDGLGCYVDSDGTRHMGMFYKNQRYGNFLSVYSTGVVRVGNWVEGRREGISLEIGDDYVVIINYRNNEVYGNKFQIFQGSEKVSEFNKSGNVGRYFY